MLIANLKNNVINSEFSSKPLPQDLLFIFRSMIDQNLSREDSSQALERFMVLILMRDEDMTALRKLTRWEDEHLSEFMKVLALFEHYQTLDGCGPGVKIKQQRGLKLNISNKHLRLLSKSDPGEFVENLHKVLQKKVTLKGVIEECAPKIAPKSQVIVKSFDKDENESVSGFFARIQTQLDGCSLSSVTVKFSCVGDSFSGENAVSSTKSQDAPLVVEKSITKTMFSKSVNFLDSGYEDNMPANLSKLEKSISSGILEKSSENRIMKPAAFDFGDDSFDENDAQEHFEELLAEKGKNSTLLETDNNLTWTEGQDYVENTYNE